MSGILATLTCRTGKVVFDSAANGLPAYFEHHDGFIPFAGGPDQLTLQLADGRRICPSAKNCAFYTSFVPGCSVLEFPRLLWQDDCGQIIPDMYLAMRYELFDDGAFFATAMLHCEDSEPPEVCHLILKQSLDLQGFDRVQCNVTPRKGKFLSADIQDDSVRNIFEKNCDQCWRGNLLSQTCFYASGQNRSSFYGEFFLESAATLSGNAADGSTRIVWENGSPTVMWDFQTCSTPGIHRPHVWRNRWGWILNPAPKQRHLAPQIIYQYIDNYRHYPDEDELQEIVSSGCTLFILHSNWRRDAVNDGVPYDPEYFSRIVSVLHEHNIRIAVYCRGNEKEITESCGAFFDRWLKKDFDGLYVDYGGPHCRYREPDEYASGGSILFYRYYLDFRRLRERVGDDGVLIVHTGPDFSNLIMAQTDGYISGEAERGALIRSRAEYEYHTRAAAAVGTLWSAAFPEYGTAAIIPMIAISGQAPHTPLGIQFVSSSLAHPPVPGINDRIYRPLWRLWKCFAQEKDISFFNDFNAPEIFSTGSNGHCLMISSDRERALLIAARLGENEETLGVDWGKCGFSIENKKIFSLRPQPDGPGEIEICTGTPFEIRFKEYPAAAFYITPDDSIPEGFSAPDPVVGAAGQRFLNTVAGQKKLRSELAGRDLELRVTVDNSICTALENSNFFDLFDNRIYLVAEKADGSWCRLGEIGKNHFYPGQDAPAEDLLHPGGTSCGIDLRTAVSGRFRKLAVQSFHFGSPFYSLISALFRDLRTQEEFRLDFFSDLEPDRSRLSWEWN